MPKTVIDSHIAIPRTALSRKTMKLLRKKLSVSNPAYSNAVRFGRVPAHFIKIPKRIDLYEEADGRVRLLRGMNLDTLLDRSELASCSVNRDRRVCAPVEMPSRLLKLHPHQSQVIKDIVHDACRHHPPARRPFGTYLVVVPVSGGKTIGSAALAATLGHRTLVIVHTKLIEATWFADLHKLFGLQPKDVGLIRGTTWRIGKQFTIASIQTLFRRQDKWPELYPLFGTVICDECHTTPARTFYDCVANMPSFYRIGITGTAQRRDKLHNIMYKIFGKPFYQLADSAGETETSLPILDVIPRFTKSRMPEEIEVTRRLRGDEVKIKIEANENDHRQAMSHIVNDKARTEMIVSDILDQMKKKHSCLVVSRFVEHAHSLFLRLRLKTEKYGIEFISGETSATDRENAVNRILKRKSRCLISTLQLIKEGANIPPLDRLFIASPMSFEGDVKQLTGRIRRKFKSPTWEKKNAKVFDYVDRDIDVLWRQYCNRVNVYRDALSIARYKDVYLA